MDAAGVHGLVEGDSNGGRGRVSVFVEVNEHLVWTSAEAFADGVNNTAVGLVRNDAFDAGDIDFAAAQRFLGSGLHCLDGVLESLLALHAKVMKARGDRVGAGRAAAAAAGHEEEIGFLAVSTHDSSEQAVGVGPVLQNSRAGPVAEKHAGIAVLPIYNGRKFLGADDEHGV